MEAQTLDSVNLFVANIWFGLLGLILVLYVVLDGFDLGVGVLSLLAQDEAERETMMGSLGSIWDANETWLVLLGGALFGAFPLVYGVLLHALYIPITLMVFGLIFRGVAFEFHEHATNKRPWAIAFGFGSLLATLSQGLALGGIIGGIEVVERAFAGSVWDWLTPFALTVALGVVFGYVLLGATYLIIKTRGALQQRSYRHARTAAWLMLAAAVIVTMLTPIIHPRIADEWFSLPTFFYLSLLPLGACLCFALLTGALRRRHEIAPFVWSLGIFVCSFAGLAITLYPNMIPPDVTIAEASSSTKTLVFMLTGIGLLLPVMMFYNGYQYFVFRGKIGEDEG